MAEVPLQKPAATSVGEIAAELQHCRACDLWERATQAVPGAGPSTARLMLVGEQPGDQEDQRGVAFVGPAGHVLDVALEEACIDRSVVYVTNAVKHFKWKPAPRGKRRLHQRPNRTETVACRQWLLAETAAVQPRLIVCLGALAGESLIGPQWKLREHRGELTTTVAEVPALLTHHPAAILRSPDHDQRAVLRAELADDLRNAALIAETI